MKKTKIKFLLNSQNPSKIAILNKFLSSDKLFRGKELSFKKHLIKKKQKLSTNTPMKYKPLIYDFTRQIKKSSEYKKFKKAKVKFIKKKQTI